MCVAEGRLAAFVDPDRSHAGRPPSASSVPPEPSGDRFLAEMPAFIVNSRPEFLDAIEILECLSEKR
jgi:hypothetical protein